MSKTKKISYLIYTRSLLPITTCSSKIEKVIFSTSLSKPFQKYNVYVETENKIWHLR